MIIFGFLLMFSYIIYDLYFDVIDIFIKNQTTKTLLLVATIVLIPQTIIIPLILRHSTAIIVKIMYTILCLLVYVFCIFLIKDIFLLFNNKINFWLPFNVFIFIWVTFCIHSFFCDSIKTTSYTVNTDKDVNKKIIFVSDLHIGNKGINKRRIKKIVSIINREKPDFIIFGGDIVEKENTFEKKKDYTEIIKQIKAKNIYGVLGNHEFYFNNNPQKMAELLQKNYKINVLMDESANVAENLTIIGRNDYRSEAFGIKRKKLSEIMENVNQDNFLLLVDHNPIDFDEAVANNIDLQLSGHIHGGQFFPFNLINRIFNETTYGTLKKKNSRLIVTSGVGTSGIPLRILVRKEVVVINIKSQ